MFLDSSSCPLLNFVVLSDKYFELFHCILWTVSFLSAIRCLFYDWWKNLRGTCFILDLSLLFYKRVNVFVSLLKLKFVRFRLYANEIYVLSDDRVMFHTSCTAYNDFFEVYEVTHWGKTLKLKENDYAGPGDMSNLSWVSKKVSIAFNSLARLSTFSSRSTFATVLAQQLQANLFAFLNCYARQLASELITPFVLTFANNFLVPRNLDSDVWEVEV